jgi:hypothetical protein
VVLRSLRIEFFRNLLRNTRGIHGMTCVMSGAAGPAIYVDSPNNSIEGVNIQSVSEIDGILVGSRALAYNNVIFNVAGNGLKDAVHISNQTNTQSAYCGATPSNSQNYYNVCDVTVLGATNTGGKYSIEDDLTNTPPLTDTNVGMYVVGEPVSGGSGPIGYSRFTTSLLVPQWLVGTEAPGTGSTCAVGSLYSQTGGSGNYTLYGCVGTGSNQWKPIK